MTEKNKERPLFPIIDRPTPIIDKVRERLEPAEDSLLKEYSWAATWVGFAMAVAALAGSR